MVILLVVRILLQPVTARVLQPGDPAAVWVALQHKGAIIVTDDDIGQPVAVYVHGDDGYGGVEVCDFILGPCLWRGQSRLTSTRGTRGHTSGRFFGWGDAVMVGFGDGVVKELDYTRPQT